MVERARVRSVDSRDAGDGVVLPLVSNLYQTNGRSPLLPYSGTLRAWHIGC